MSLPAHVLELVVLFWDVVESLGGKASLKKMGSLEAGLEVYRLPLPLSFLSTLLRCDRTTIPVPQTGTHSHDYLPSPPTNWASIYPSLPKFLLTGISHQWENTNNAEDWYRELGLLQWQILPWGSWAFGADLWEKGERVWSCCKLENL